MKHITLTLPPLHNILSAFLFGSSAMMDMPMSTAPHDDAPIEEIVLATPTVSPSPSPAIERPARELPDGRVLTQTVHAMVERLEREHALTAMARYLRSYREDVLRITQDDMAFLLDVARGTYQRMEAAHEGVAIGVWLRAMQVVKHLPTLSNLDFARDRALKSKITRIAQEASDAAKKDLAENPRYG